jgi:hypothetical protein
MSATISNAFPFTVCTGLLPTQILKDWCAIGVLCVHHTNDRRITIGGHRRCGYTGGPSGQCGQRCEQGGGVEKVDLIEKDGKRIFTSTTVIVPITEPLVNELALSVNLLVPSRTAHSTLST